MCEKPVAQTENYTAKFASLIVNTHYESLSMEAITRAKDSILDCLGAAMAGTTEPASEIMVNFVNQLGGNDQCTVIGSGFKTSPPLAALANGVTTHVLEFDDAAGEAWSAHPSTVVFPAVMAICESRHLSGREMILAYIMGLEAGARIGRAMREGHYEFGYVGGWQNTNTIGSLASCAAASKALKLNVEKTSTALGIAGSLASGLNKANVGTMTKPMHAGNGARNGVVASLLAEQGFTGSQNVLEGKWGFCSMFTNGRECHFYKLVDGFAAPLDIISPGITFKPFPSCRATHPSIDAILRLKSKYNIKISEITEIICRTSVHLYEVLKYHRPQNVLEAKFSLEYCIALTLLEGEVRLKHFREDRWLKDAAIQQLISKIHYEYPQPWETGLNAPQEIVIKTKDGKEFVQKVTMPDTKGVPANPMAKIELRQKFMECAGTLLPPDKVNRALELLENLEALNDLSELMELLRIKAG